MANQLDTSQTDAHAWSMVNLMNRSTDSSVLGSKLSDRVVISWFVWRTQVSEQSDAAVQTKKCRQESLRGGILLTSSTIS
jgi:hypothetical protein